MSHNTKDMPSVFSEIERYYITGIYSLKCTWWLLRELINYLNTCLQLNTFMPVK